MSLGVAIKNFINKITNNTEDNSGIVIPNWLQHRKYSDNDTFELKEFFKHFDINYFSEITRDIISDYFKYNYEKAYRLSKILSLYGVKFLSPKLRNMSESISNNPVLLRSKYTEEEIYTLKLNISQIDFLINKESERKFLDYLKNVGITKIVQLNGLCLDVLTKHIDANYDSLKSMILNTNIEIIDEKHLIENFYSYESKNEEFIDPEGVAEDDNADLIKYVDFYHIFSTRTENVLKANGINNIEQLKSLTENQILAFKNAGNKTVREIIDKLDSEELNELYEEEEKLRQHYLENGDYQNILKNIEEFYDNGNILDARITSLKISARTSNTLIRNGILTLGNITEHTEKEIKKLKGLGNQSYDEILNLLNAYELSFSCDPETALDYSIEDLKIDERYLINIFEQFELSDSTKNIIKFLNIKNIGQLLEIFPNKFYENDNCLTDNITEIENSLKELGFTEYPVKFSNAQREKLNEPTLSEILQMDLTERFAYSFHKIQEFVDSKDGKYSKVFEGRFKTSKKRTLEELGRESGVTRERIRQIEVKLERKLKPILQKEIRKFEIIMNKLFNEFGHILTIYTARLNDSINEYSALIDKFINENGEINFKIDCLNGLILFSNLNIENFYENLLNEISEEFINIEVLRELFNQKLLLIIRNDSESRYDNFIKVYEILINKFIAEYLIKFDDNTYKLKSNRSQLNEKIAYHFKVLFPAGEYIYQKEKEIIEKLTEQIPELKNYSKRAIIARLLNYSDSLILWGKGFYIHKDNVNPDWKTVDEALARCLVLFDNGINDFKVDKLYYEREEDYKNANIPDSRALYSLLRLKNDPRLILEEWPRICDSNIGRDRRELTDVFSDYIKNQKGFISSEVVKNYFCNERGWKNFQLELVYGRASDVVRTNEGYIHLDNIAFNNKELEKIAQIIQKKLDSTGNTIHLRKIQEENSVTWNSVCGYDISPVLMGLLLNRQQNLCFKIERKVYAKPSNCNEVDNNETTLAQILLSWLLEKSNQNKYVVNKEIYEFCEQQGFNIRTGFYTLKKAGALEYLPDAHVHPDTVGYSDEMLEDIVEIAEQASILSYEKNLPYIRFELILQTYKDKLPVLNENYEWTEKLLSSVISKLNTVEVFEGAFIFKENRFNVEDLDDTVAYIIAKNCPEGICKINKLEKMLWRESILKMKESINNYRQELFAEGSSIQLVDDGTNVMLSKIGRECYFNND